MCSTRSILGIFTASLVLATPVLGQVKKGLNEVNVSGALNVANAEGESFTVFTFTGTASRFVSNNISVGGSLTFLKAEGVDAVGNFAGLVSMHFASSEEAKSVPYIGATVGHGYGNNFDNPFIFGGFIGVKHFVASGGGAVSIQPFYTRENFEGGGVNNYGVLTGISIFFE